MYAKLLKVFYCIFGIKFHKNISDFQYAIKNLSRLTQLGPIQLVLEGVKPVQTVVHKGVLDSKIKKYVDRK